MMPVRCSVIESDQEHRMPRPPRAARRLTLVAVVLGALAAPAAAPAALTFGPPQALPGSLPGGTSKFQGGEPSVSFDPAGDGHVYVVAPGGDGSGPGVSFWRSADHGATFGPGRAIGSTAGGGDSDVEVGIDHTVYVADLELAANAICRSHDFGATFDGNCETGTANNQQGPESDRQWLNHDPHNANLLYFTYHDFAAEFPLIYRSTNGGSSFTPCGNPYQPGSDAFLNYGTGGTDVGKPAIAGDGTMYVPITEPDQASPVTAPYNHFDVAIAKGGCTGTTQFTNSTVYTAPGANLANIFSSVAVDGGGTVYALSAGTLVANQPTYDVYLWVSHDQGATWTRHTVNPPDLKANVLPALAGGLGKDQVAVGWYGTATSGDPSNAANEWRYYAATSTDGGNSFDRATITPTPYHYGKICTGGITCTGGRNLLDFSSIAVDPSDGTVTAVFPGDPFDTPQNKATDSAAAYIARSTSLPRLAVGVSGASANATPGVPGARVPVACAASGGFLRVGVAKRSHGVGVTFARRGSAPVNVDVFQSSHGRTVIGERLVARFRNRSRSFTWNGAANRPGRHVADGYYFLRYQVRYAGQVDTRRVVLRRVNGRFVRRPEFYRRASCGTISAYKLERPVFGGPANRALGVAFRLTVPGRASVTVLRGTRVVRRYAAHSDRAARTYRLRFPAEGRPVGDYRFKLTVVTSSGKRVTAVLTSRRI
jgi:hypothetical protein